MYMVYCKFCDAMREDNEFASSLLTNTNPKCNICVHQYYVDHQSKIKARSKQNYINNKDEILIKEKERSKLPEVKDRKQKASKKYREVHAAEIVIEKAEYAKSNKVEIAAYKAKYKDNNKEAIAKKDRNYYLNNKEKINARQRKNSKERKATDPSYKLRGRISTMIYQELKKNGGSKCNQSIVDALGETYIDEYKKWLEILWAHPDNLTPDGKVWMSWNNYGQYIRKTWIDDDYSTHTWNVDHIIPRSHLPSSTMDTENFYICWALDNIRPLSAKQNIRENRFHSLEDITRIKASIAEFLKKP